jgi:hypothetical protein
MKVTPSEILSCLNDTLSIPDILGCNKFFLLTILNLKRDVINKPPNSTNLHTLFIEVSRILISANLLQVQVIFERDILCFLDVIDELLSFHSR